MARLNWLNRVFNQLAGATDSAVYYDLVDKTGAVYPAGTPPYKLVPANTLAQAGTPHSAENDNKLLQIEDFDVAATANKPIVRDAAARAKVANPAVAGDIANKGYVDTALGTPTDAATPSQIIKRDASGRAKIVAPSDNGDIANKGYIDMIINGIHLLHEKIRDISDTSGANISIDISDINWTTYREIFFQGKVRGSVGANISFVLNNVFTSYATTTLTGGSAALTTTTSCLGQAEAAVGTYWQQFSIKLWKNNTGSNVTVSSVLQFHAANTSAHVLCIGHSNEVATNTLQLSPSSAATLYIEDVELWGVLR